MPIAVLSEYTEKEYEPFDPYSRFYPAMPISVCFSDTALCTLGEAAASVFTLQRSMIASFGEWENGWIVDDITAAVVCLFVMGIGFQILFRKKKEEMKR